MIDHKLAELVAADDDWQALTGHLWKIERRSAFFVGGTVRHSPSNLFRPGVLHRRRLSFLGSASQQVIKVNLETRSLQFSGECLLPPSLIVHTNVDNTIEV